MERDLEAVDPVARPRLDLEVIPDDRLREDAAEQPLADVPNQVAPLGPVGREAREMNVQSPRNAARR